MDSSEVGRESQVAAQLMALDKANEALSETVAELEVRLVQILRNEENVKGLSESRQELVPLAQQIMEQADKVGGCTDRLRDIIGRIEL